MLGSSQIIKSYRCPCEAQKDDYGFLPPPPPAVIRLPEWRLGCGDVRECRVEDFLTEQIEW